MSEAAAAPAIEGIVPIDPAPAPEAADGATRRSTRVRKAPEHFDAEALQRPTRKRRLAAAGGNESGGGQEEGGEAKRRRTAAKGKGKPVKSEPSIKDEEDVKIKVEKSDDEGDAEESMEEAQPGEPEEPESEEEWDSDAPSRRRSGRGRGRGRGGARGGRAARQPRQKHPWELLPVAATPGAVRETFDNTRPNGYVYFHSGNQFMTLNCKKASLASGRDFYEHRYWDRVGGRYFPKTTGYSCPTDVYNAIVAKQQYTQEKRAASSEKREDRLLEEAEAAMDRLFPSIPADDRQAILDRAFEKGSGRIGRKAGFSMDEKILLASRAHIRYQHTDFEDVLERIKDGYRNMGERWDRHEVYDEAVAEVDGEVDEVVRLWRAPRAAAPLVAALPAQRTPQQAPLGAPSAVSPAPGAAKVEEWEAKDVKKLDPKDELKLEPAEVPSIEARVGKAEPSSEVAVKKEPAVPVVKVEKDDRME